MLGLLGLRMLVTLMVAFLTSLSCSNALGLVLVCGVGVVS